MDRAGVQVALRVLVVEDDPTDERMLVEQLALCRTLRFEVHACASLAAALAHEMLATADVVLLDLGLPDSVGLDTCRRFLAAAPAVPVLVLTGMDGESIGVEAVQQGAQDFLPKASVDPLSLGRAIRHAMERQAMLDALRRAAATARDREQGLRRLLERSVEALVVVASDGIVRFANRSASALLRVATAELEGARWDEVVPEVAAEGQDEPFEVVLARPGAASPAEVRAMPIEWEGQPARLVSLLDLTDRRRAERMALAQGVQRAFLPEASVATVGCLAAAAMNELCEDVSGDLYDFVRLSDGRMLIALGDVTGHGLGAALLMAQARASLRAFAAAECDVSVLMSRMNRVVEGETVRGAFLTLLLAAIDPATARVEWASAGHSLAAELDPEGRARPLPATAPPLWVSPDTRFHLGEPFTLEEGGGLAVFSDGAVEVPDGRGCHLGLEGVLSSFSDHWLAPPPEVLRRVREDLRRWTRGHSLPDDLTLLALRRTPMELRDRRGARPTHADPGS
ncbi:MAG TPA: SpoIIE family protein phosphatase [Planctomycetota bacterium]|nr:SpoIIE family protein phosphatase [Planctomycetota bacterium]